MRFFSRKLSNDQRHKKGMIKKHFSQKAGEADIFLNAKRSSENEIGTNIVGCKGHFVGFCVRGFGGGVFRGRDFKKNRKTMKDFFLRKKHQMTEFQKKKFLEGLNKLFFIQKKKRVNFSCSKEHDWKNKWEKRSETTKEIEQKQFCKKGWTNEKKYQKKKKGDFFFEGISRRSIRERERERVHKHSERQALGEGNMERERRKKKKRKSVENKKTNSKESKHEDMTQMRENKLRRKSKRKKLRESRFFFEVNFFRTETKGLRQKKQAIFQKRDWKQRIAKCFWRSCMKK